MAQKSGFFTALLNAGVYDRTYRAEDYTDNLAVVISTGVLRSANDDLKVTASGLNLSVNAGRAWINGHYYHNEAAYAMPAVTPPTGGSRIDRLVLRCDTSIPVRAIALQYIEGTAATSPVAPAITRNDTVYDICLAEITVAANASTVTVKDTRSDADICGWVYSTSGDNSFFTSLDNSFNEWFESVKNNLASVTLFKRYKSVKVISTQTTVVSIDIPQYDPDTCFLEVYVNGFLEVNYTVSSNTITFGAAVNAGAEVVIYAFKSIDGTGIMTVADEITELQNEYAALSGVSNLTYKATGEDDNISLSEIAQAIYAGSYTAAEVTEAADAFLTALGGNTWLASLYDGSQVTIQVVGKLGVTTPAYGSGTTQSRYRYFNFGVVSAASKRIIFDFAKAETIQIAPEANTNNIIFYGTDLDVRNASVDVETDGANSNVQMIAGSNAGRINVENCNFDILCSGDGKIGEAGTYFNCDCRIRSEAGHALLFCPKSNYLIRVIGGRHLAYAIVSGKTASIFYTYGTETNAVIMAQNINCPTVTVSGYWQQYLSVGYAGKTIIDLVTSTMNSTGNYNVISNQVWLSKPW
jgi:hypothetical protein